SLLDGGDGAGGEAAAIAGRLHLIDDRQTGIARAQEVTMNRVPLALRRHCLAGSGQGLSENLATEQLAKAKILTQTTQQILFYLLPRQQADQGIQVLAHRGSSTALPPGGGRGRRHNSDRVSHL